jgi:hypothetical protein
MNTKNKKQKTYYAYLDDGLFFSKTRKVKAKNKKEATKIAKQKFKKVLRIETYS